MGALLKFRSMHLVLRLVVHLVMALALVVCREASHAAPSLPVLGLVVVVMRMIVRRVAALLSLTMMSLSWVRCDPSFRRWRLQLELMLVGDRNAL